MVKTLTDEQLAEGARLYAACVTAAQRLVSTEFYRDCNARDLQTAERQVLQWLAANGSALFAMAERAARYDAAVREHLDCSDQYGWKCDLTVLVRAIYAERDRAEQRDIELLVDDLIDGREDECAEKREEER